MRKKYWMAALMCAVCLTAGAAAASAAETEEMTEAPGAEAETEEDGEFGVLGERPDYRALDYVTLGSYKGLEVEIEPDDFAVTEEDIDDKIQQEIKDADLYEELAEEKIREGDIANIDYEGKLDGEAFDGGTAQGFDLEIGSHSFIDGFEEGLVGVSVGETLDLPLTFPENYGNEELAGKDVVFTVTVNAVKRMPELTDALADEVSEGAYTDVASYRTHVQEELQADMEETKKNWLYGELLTLIANTSEVNGYPEELIEYSVNNMRSYYEQYAQMYGMEYADFLSTFLGLTEEEFDAQADISVRQNIRQEMLLKAVAETEKIDLSEEEFTSGCERYAEEYGYETGEELLDAYGEQVVRLSLIQDETMEFVLDNAIVEEVAETEETSGPEETSGDGSAEAETQAE